MNGTHEIVQVRSNRSKVAPHGAMVEGQVAKNIRDAAAGGVGGVVACHGGVIDRHLTAVVDVATAVGAGAIGRVIGHGAVFDAQRPVIEDAAAIGVIGVILSYGIAFEPQRPFVVDAAAVAALGIPVLDRQVRDGGGVAMND